jgi:hypothetical protein
VIFPGDGWQKKERDRTRGLGARPPPHAKSVSGALFTRFLQANGRGKHPARAFPDSVERASSRSEDRGRLVRRGAGIGRAARLATSQPRWGHVRLYRAWAPSLPRGFRGRDVSRHLPRVDSAWGACDDLPPWALHVTPQTNRLTRRPMRSQQPHEFRHPRGSPHRASLTGAALWRASRNPLSRR